MTESIVQEEYAVEFVGHGLISWQTLPPGTYPTFGECGDVFDDPSLADALRLKVVGFLAAAKNPGNVRVVVHTKTTKTSYSDWTPLQRRVDYIDGVFTLINPEQP